MKLAVVIALVIGAIAILYAFIKVARHSDQHY